MGACLLASGGAPPLGARQQVVPPEHLVEEEIAVVEVPIVVELPRRLSRPDPEELTVREGDRLWPVSALTRLEGERWEVLLYLDAVLADSETSFRGILALARRAAELIALGPVTVIVADPEPRVLLEASEEERLLEETLATLAGRRLGSDGVGAVRRELTSLLPEERTPSVVEALHRREVETVVRQLEALRRVTAERCPGPPCALVLVCSGFELRPEEVYLTGAGAVPGAVPGEVPGEVPQAIRAAAEGVLERATDELVVELASGGWTVLAVPFRRIREPGPPARRWSDFDDWSVDEGLLVPLVRKRPPQRHEALPIETLDYLILPSYAPLRRLAQGTGGSLARAEQELTPLLERYAQRWLLWYTRAESPEPLTPQRLEVLDLRRGERLRAPAWAPAHAQAPEPE